MRVAEIFASIQGEGRYVGKPQTFVRLSGCNLRCSWCDTKYAWEGGVEKTLDEVIKEVDSFGLRSVCITGGEPLFQVMETQELVRHLKNRGYEVVLETNGTLYDREIFGAVDCVSMDMKPPSSGMKSDEGLLKYLAPKDQVKVVLKDAKDMEYAKSILQKTKVEVYLMPEGGEDMRWISDEVVKLRLGVRVLPQVHKITGLK